MCIIINQPPQDLGVALISSSLNAFASRNPGDITGTVFQPWTRRPCPWFYKTNASSYIKLFVKIDLHSRSSYGNWTPWPASTILQQATMAQHRTEWDWETIPDQ